MNFKQMLDDDRAVSPVIGIILMVAITVILAAVIGTFVLGLGNKVTGSTAPQATWDTATTSGDVKVAHNGGDPVKGSNLKIMVGSTDVTKSGDDYQFASGNSDSDSDGVVDALDKKFTAGTGFTVQDTGTSNDGDKTLSGETVKIVWVSPDDGSTQVLTEYTA